MAEPDITEASKGFDATKQRIQARELELARLDQRKRAALSAVSDERSGPRRDELRSLYNKLDLEHEKQKVRLKELKGIHGPHRTYHEERAMRRAMRRAAHEEARRAASEAVGEAKRLLWQGRDTEAREVLRSAMPHPDDLRARRAILRQIEDEVGDIAPRAGIKNLGREQYGYITTPNRTFKSEGPIRYRPQLAKEIGRGARFGGGVLAAAALDLMGREEHTPQEYYREQGRGIAEMTGLNPAYGEDPATDPREVAAILMALEAAQRAGVPYEERFPEGIRVAPGEAAMTPAQVENVRAMQRQRR